MKSILPGSKGGDETRATRPRRLWLLAIPLALLLGGWLSATTYLWVNQLEFVHHPDGYGGRTMLA